MPRILVFALMLPALLQASLESAEERVFEPFFGTYEVVARQCNLDGKPTERGCDLEQIEILYRDVTKTQLELAEKRGGARTGYHLYQRDQREQYGSEEAYFESPYPESAAWVYYQKVADGRFTRERRLIFRERDYYVCRFVYEEKSLFGQVWKLERRFTLRKR